MKTLFLSIALFFTLSITAQIGSVILDRGYAKIYNSKMQYSGHCIYIANSVYVGHSNQYVVIQNDDYAKIYNQTGDYTGHSIYVGRYAYVYGVTLNSILIEKDNYLKEYDFSGRYTGRSIYNPQKR